jgi:CoA:oxalate CoA-transferase
MSADSSGAPLSGIVVLDLTTFLSGPYVTQILADLGAEVIKIEQPGSGDPTRVLPPHFVKGESAYFLSINRNKKSVAVDLKHERGRELILGLVATCDVLIENFRPGVMDRLGLTAEILRKANPKVVHCSLTGFGGDGPYQRYPAYDMIVQALSGGMSMTGERDGMPVRAGIPIGDLAAGMFSVIGILAALVQRGQTGEGRHVDVSMLDCQISMLSYQAQYALISGKAPGRQGAAHDSIPTYRSFLCRDGQHLVVTANNERMWKSLCEVLGRPALAKDPRFLSNALRFDNQEALSGILEKLFLGHDSDVIFLELMEAGVPAAPIKSVTEALDDPQVVHRAMVADTGGTDGRSLRMVGSPIKFSGNGVVPPVYPPRLAEHTAEILSSRLGLSASAVEKLVADGIVGAAKMPCGGA